MVVPSEKERKRRKRYYLENILGEANGRWGLLLMHTLGGSPGKTSVEGEPEKWEGDRLLQKGEG